MNRPTTTRTPAIFTCAFLMAVSLQAASPIVPIRFEENRGQATADVAFLSRTPQYNVFLKQRTVVVASRRGQTVNIALGGASHTNPRGVVQMPGKSNYLIGNDADQWLSGIVNYERVTYPQIYSGVDLVWHGDGGGQLEYDFEVAAGADARQIQLDFSGASA